MSILVYYGIPNEHMIQYTQTEFTEIRNIYQVISTKRLAVKLEKFVGGGLRSSSLMTLGLGGHGWTHSATATAGNNIRCWLDGWVGLCFDLRLFWSWFGI